MLDDYGNCEKDMLYSYPAFLRSLPVNIFDFLNCHLNNQMRLIIRHSYNNLLCTFMYCVLHVACICVSIMNYVTMSDIYCYIFLSLFQCSLHFRLNF